MREQLIEPKTPPIQRTGKRLTPAELRTLAEKMVAATDPVEVDRLKKEMERGFYGDPAHA